MIINLSFIIKVNCIFFLKELNEIVYFEFNIGDDSYIISYIFLVEVFV